MKDDAALCEATMIHPVTGARLTRRRRTEIVSYMGYSKEIEAEGYFPDDGGDGIISGSDHKVFDAALHELKECFAKDSKRLAKSVRAAAGLTQKEASLLLTGSPNSFSKYERGEAQPSWPTFVLLKLIADDPGLIEKIKAA